MIEITGDDIAKLTDEDLRALIGLLCEAETRKYGIPRSSITWGGHHNARDGGLDVRVAAEQPILTADFIPRPHTGFQVKKPDMPPSAIEPEMRPEGVLRPTIADLAARGGAYVIVSGTGSTTESALRSRGDAMRAAVADDPNGGKLFVDFYDRGRIATWVREHPALIAWVRARIGKPLVGWHPYGSWSRIPANVDASFLIDEIPRVHTGRQEEGGLTILAGIHRMREILALPGGVVRLVGLSGVGKTRLTEALFDASVGDNALDPAAVYYTDTGEDPDPPPIALASTLIAEHQRAILVVDNCPPDVHKKLCEIAASAGSSISLLTIEYDIADDEPEGTEVFWLDASSESLIDALLRRRHSQLSQLDRQRVAEFAGGNALIALALARTAEKSGSLASLGDLALTRRLFLQRNQHDPALQRIAETCSLLYSFDGMTRDGTGAELPILATLSRCSVADVFEAVAELQRRHIAQSRGQWRAVLPHALANRLAGYALQNIHPDTVESLLVDNAPERVFRSFSRRLGYLHESEHARAIVKRWLAPGGRLYDVLQLGEIERQALENVAPVVPEDLLLHLETALSTADEATIRRSTHLVPLVQSLAYDAHLFERAVALLLALVTNEPSTDSRQSFEPVSSLFSILLSGTRAPLSVRLNVLSGFLSHANPLIREVGVHALRTALQTSGFSTARHFEFGGRSRDYGYEPKSFAEVQQWFRDVLQLAERFAQAEAEVSAQVRTVVAQQLRGLWSESGSSDEVERVARVIGSASFWRDGWIAVIETQQYHHPDDPAEADRLSDLEEFLRPKALIDKVRGYVLCRDADYYRLHQDHLDQDRRTRRRQAQDRGDRFVEDLGRDAGRAGGVFDELLPELLLGSRGAAVFGRGYAAEIAAPREPWRRMLEVLKETPNAHAGLMLGFIEGALSRDPEVAEDLLVDLFTDPELTKWYPVVQSALPLDERGLERLHNALASGVTGRSFYHLAHGALDTVPGDEFRRLVLAIADAPDGYPVAFEIISMRVFREDKAGRIAVPEVISTGRELLDRFVFSRDDDRDDYDRERVARYCLGDDEGKQIAPRLCRNLMNAVADYQAFAYHHGQLVGALVKLHPREILDELFADAKLGVRTVQQMNDFRHYAMANVPDDVLLNWCDDDPAVRYPIAAATVTIYKKAGELSGYEWTELAYKLLSRAPDPAAALGEIVRRLAFPSGWSGSLATKLESRLQLLDRLELTRVAGAEPALAQAKAALRSRIASERERELEESRANAGFE